MNDIRFAMEWESRIPVGWVTTQLLCRRGRRLAPLFVQGRERSENGRRGERRAQAYAIKLGLDPAYPTDIRSRWSRQCHGRPSGLGIRRTSRREMHDRPLAYCLVAL